jgi:chemotaxis response regulator CheB
LRSITFCVTAVAAHRPDLVLHDLAMPVLDGRSAIPPLLEASPAPTLGVFSGFNAGSAADEALGLGAAAFVEKGLIDTALPGLDATEASTEGVTGDLHACDSLTGTDSCEQLKQKMLKKRTSKALWPISGL